jgi:hypothetical protein
MTYKSFINTIITIISGTTLSGINYLDNITFCLESEIGIDKTTVINQCTCYITPIPITFNDTGIMRFACKVYFISSLTDKDTTKRIQVYDNLISFISNFLYKLINNTNIHETYPIEITTGVNTDFDADGIYFTLTTTDTYDCNV